MCEGPCPRPLRSRWPSAESESWWHPPKPRTGCMCHRRGVPGSQGRRIEGPGDQAAGRQGREGRQQDPPVLALWQRGPRLRRLQSSVHQEEGSGGRVLDPRARRQATGRPTGPASRSRPRQPTGHPPTIPLDQPAATPPAVPPTPQIPVRPAHVTVTRSVVDTVYLPGVDGGGPEPAAHELGGPGTERRGWRAGVRGRRSALRLARQPPRTASTSWTSSPATCCCRTCGSRTSTSAGGTTSRSRTGPASRS